MTKRSSSPSAPPPIPPTLSSRDAHRLLSAQAEKGRGVLANRPIDEGAYDAWENTTREFLIQAFGSDSGNVMSFGRARSRAVFLGGSEEDYEGRRADNIDNQLKMLASAIEQLDAQIQLRGELLPEHGDPSDPLPAIERIASRFHIVARQLRDRHADRPTLSVSDEYDVQDLFQALLRLFFEDIRPEEWTPSYAGGAARIDFLLKQEQVIVEIKKTREGLTPRELGSQLIEDIARYQSHPDCKALICFVYDPEGRIPNPKGLEHDLSRDDPPPKVKVFLGPKGL